DGGLAVTPLTGEARADIAIIGGGFTGLWTALHIKALEPAADIAIIDKSLCGGGASGRNGGFCMTWSSKALPLIAACGRQEALRLIRASEESVRAIGRFCADHAIDAQFRHDGWLWTASNPSQVDAWQPTLEALAALGAPTFETLTPAQVAARSGTPVTTAGVYDPHVATVQPALLARGMARVARQQGVRLYEHSPVVRLRRGNPVVIDTAGPAGAGRLTAGRAVLALNAWAAELPEFRTTFVPVGVDMLISVPVPDLLAGTGLAGGLAVSDVRVFVNFLRSTPDGRIAMGKGGSQFFWAGRVGQRADGAARDGAALTASFRRFFGHKGPIAIADTWHGPVTRTLNGLPHFGRLAGHPNIAYGHGYCGNGVGPSWTGGRILASLALGRRDEWTDSPLVNARQARRLPPEPLRYVGSRLVSAAAGRVEAAQDRGRPGRRLDRALARLAPPGLAPIR
ncbi:MAG: FAD-dependent oxidoreductase, partial [Alphaproteobacteria bacterium]